MNDLTVDKDWFAGAIQDRRVRIALAAFLALVVLLVWWLLRGGGGVLGGGDDEEPTTPTGPHTDALIIPDIDLDAPLLTIQMHGEVLTPPSDTDAVGWWDGSAKPGARSGRTIVTGHTVHTGGGVMNRLAEVDEGDKVQVRIDGEMLRFEATKVETYPREYVDTHAEQLLGQKRGDNQLVLITCADWEGTEYQSNVFVYAKPLATKAARDEAERVLGS